MYDDFFPSVAFCFDDIRCLYEHLRGGWVNDASQAISNNFKELFKSGHNELNATTFVFFFLFLEFAEKTWVGHSHAGIATTQLSPLDR